MTLHMLAATLLWTAMGDALGLPYEGLSPARAQKLLGPPTRYRLLAGKGFISDDTEHALLTAEALARSGGDAATFERELAQLLREWVSGLPAGIGLATLRACGKLALGLPAAKSGVYSAGNGPMMRGPVLGAAVEDRAKLRELVRVSSRITHTDPKAEYAAYAVALAAWCEARGQRGNFLALLREDLPEDDAARELLDVLAQALAGAWQPDPRGVSGYAYHTAPAVIAAWAQAENGVQAIQNLIALGGDTDTTAAILGGILGAGGELPPELWLAGLQEDTLNGVPNLTQRVERAMQHGETSRAPLRFGPQRWPRNALFAGVVLAHGFRRLGPPY